MYAISRMKAKKNAWYWQVSFRRRGKPYEKRFNDLIHGGSKKALAAAIRWRDGRLSRSRVLTLREFCQQKRSNNTSGVPGVHFLTPKRMPQGIWQAKIKLPDGRTLHRTFSVRKFGQREAFKRAVAARAELLYMIEDRPYIKHPTARRFAQRTSTRTRHGND
jgi:hypothetical protein